VVTGSGFGGLWLVLIGFFLVNAAAAEEQQVKLSASLRGVLVGHVMTPRPVIADGNLTVDEFVRELAWTHPFSSYPLVDAAGRLAGLVTLNRIRAVPRERWASTRLADIACRPDDVPVARPEEPLTDLLPRMSGCADGRAVVVDTDGRVVGIVSSTDVSRAVQRVNLLAPDPFSPPAGADLVTVPDRDRHR
jgi:CBS domain-containing protein